MSEMKNVTPSEAIKDIPSHLIAEFINGKVITQPRPALRHANVGTTLSALLIPPFKMGINGSGGWVILAEP